jgi:hypothetical protein
MPYPPRGARADSGCDAPNAVAGGSPNGQADNPPAANHIALPVGFALHEYTIEALLGAGGFGVTYLARDNNLHSQVAIKEYLPSHLAVRAAGQTVLPRSDADSPGFQLGLEGFLAEARTLAGFRHPNIVRVSRFFEANRTAYVVMDYEQGQPLRDWLPGHAPVDEAVLKRMFLPLLDGLAVVHDAGVLHRDIKPANIYVRDGDGSLVLLDFGAARQSAGVVSRSLTSVITPGYAPFEQYHTSGDQGPWTDLYALAGVLYWLVTGQKPHEAPSRVKEDTMPPAVAAAAGRYSPGFLAAIDWALRVDEEARPRSVADFRRVLLGEVPVPAGAAASAAAPPVGGRRASLVGVVAAVALLAGLGILVLSRLGAPPVSPVEAPAAEAVAAPQPAAPPTAEAGRSESRATDVAPPRAQQKSVSTETAAPQAVGSATLLFQIAPPGEPAVVFIDGRKVGNSPALTEYRVAPGKHKVEIHGNRKPWTHHFWVNLKPGEKKKIWARFADES